MNLQEKFHIADLHCDLLWYLSLDPKRSAHDLQARCSIPQLREGRVKLQTMAIFTETDASSVENGKKQAEIFKRLPSLYPDTFTLARQAIDLDVLVQSNTIGIVPAIENASAICNETEDISKGLERLTNLQKKIGKMLYVSLTWNSENRFGGGALTKVGLKEDGKILVDYLSERRVALDFSHTSDYLAYDLLNYIDKKGLQLPVLASHSNMRAVTNVPRNLPDEITKEIIKRNGVIGINFIRYFLGSESIQYFSRQIEHLLKLGAEDNICFGADFFSIEDLPLSLQKPLDVLFFPEYNHAGSYEKVLELWKSELKLGDKMIKKIASINAIRFLNNVL